MKKKNLKLLILLTTLALSTTLKIMPPPVHATATLTAPTITDATLTPNTETFRINITVANVQKLGGYQLILSYNTGILSALDAGSYPPFNTQVVSEINNTVGYVSMGYWTYFGDPNGLSTTDPRPIAWIEFIVDDYGISVLDLSNTGLSDILGTPISHTVVDGSFTNLIDIAVTNVTTSETTVNKGEPVNINVTVTNQGGSTETFSVTAYYDTIAIQTKTVSNLAPGNSESIQFTWDTTYVPPDTYTIKAEAEILQGEIDTADNEFIDNTITIVRLPRAPIANFTYSPEQPLESKPVTFNASLSTPNGGTLISYAWNFGDDTTETGKIVNHTYPTMGTYTVTLNVTDNEGKSDAVQTIITIYRHDIAVSDVTPRKTEAKAGENIEINVTVVNLGNLNETFSVTLKINETEIETKTVTNLAPEENRTLTFNWNTTGLEEGVYIPSAEATVENETYTDDNTRTGDLINIKSEKQWLPNLLIVAVVATAFALIIVLATLTWYYMRRR